MIPMDTNNMFLVLGIPARSASFSNKAEYIFDSIKHIEVSNVSVLIGS